MTDEDKKRIVSEPPPPTDEIDQEWGDDDQTLIRHLPEGVAKSQPAPPSAAVSGTAVAPISGAPKAAEASTPPEMKAAPLVDEEEEEDDEDEDEESSAPANEDDEDEDEDEDEDDEVSAQLPARGAAAPASDWLPDWAPYAVLAALVSVSILVGLGLVGGGSNAATEEEQKAAEPAGAALKAPAKPSPHP
jgi:hypothetical protein